MGLLCIASQYGFFFDAHRTVTDCQALLEILQHSLPKSSVITLKRLVDKVHDLELLVSREILFSKHKGRLIAARFTRILTAIHNSHRERVVACWR